METTTVRYATLALCLFVLLAGCSFGWSEPDPASDDPARYNVTNAEPTDQAIAVGVVAGPVESLELRFENGTTRTVSPPLPETPAEPQSAVYALRNVSTVGVPGLRERESLARCGGEERLFSADFLVGSYGPAVGIGCTGA